MIGIIGGMGPQAHNNLFECIIQNTKVKKDQDHLPVLLWSEPSSIADRSEFLLGETATNPAIVVSRIAQQLHKLGVQVIGIPCNTFHAQPIWNVLIERMDINNESNLQIIHMIEVTVETIVKLYPKATIGILGTLGTFQYNVYGNALTAKQISFIQPDEIHQKKVHQSIYDVKFGIKVTGKINDESLQLVYNVIQYLISNGADTILLGCTELSLIPFDKLPKEIIFVDPVVILAKAMIKAYRIRKNLMI